MSNTVKRSILLLLALSFLASAAVLTFTHRGVSHAVTALSVYFGSDNDYFYALDAPHGTLRWTYQYQQGGNTWSPAVVVNGVLFFEGANSSSTAAVSLRNDGSKRWIYTFPAQTSCADAVAVANNLGYFSVNSNVSTSNIDALNIAGGPTGLTYDAGNHGHFGNPVAYNGVLYVAE